MRLIRLLFVAALSSQLVGAQDQESTSENAGKFTELAGKHAAAYTIRAGGEPLVLRADSVLNWTNPLDGELHGGVFVWTREGRPAVVAAIFKWYRPFTHMTHEFQSLTTEPLAADREDRTVWRTSEPGVTWKRVPEAQPPADAPRQRLLQLRAVARKFSVELSEKDGTNRRLRLLSQPLLRYSCPSEDVVDGALFAFAKGTDPEAILLLEARGKNSGKHWEYAIARLNFLEMEASHSGKQVWSVDHLPSPDIYSHVEAYTKFPFDEAEQ